MSHFEPPSPCSVYDPSVFEAAVQARWLEEKTFRSPQPDAQHPPYYCLSMFPYPSGQLHMGHVRNYALSDVLARLHRRLGYAVLHPMGWDAFGLPAENAALKHGGSPAEWTYNNIAQMREQLKKLGLSFDWERELATCDPHYYCFEQEFFLQMYEKGLAYRKESAVNWDPVDNTVLANEQVIDGRGWRSGALVEQRQITQWFLKITDYAPELLEGLKSLDQWPAAVKTMQEHWIGQKKGWRAPALFSSKAPLAAHSLALSVFYSDPTEWAQATFVKIALDHPWVRDLMAAEGAQHPELLAYVEQLRHRGTAQALSAVEEKKAFFTGYSIVHPLDATQMLPLWIVDPFDGLESTEALLGCPQGHELDQALAQSYNLPLCPPTPLSQTGHPPEALEHTQYRLRDWGISRQRYWGAPIPIIHCPVCGVVPVPRAQLPVVLPDLKLSDVHSPLKQHSAFLHSSCPQCGHAAERETDTFDTFMESSWYFIRFAGDTPNDWLSVHQYIGGIEHAILHLLYARFIHKVLRDLGYVSCAEPFQGLLTQGMVLKDGAKMSKSKGNVVEPTSLLQSYGADTLRLFVLFAAPPEQSLEWSDAGIEGAHRFLKRLWALVDRLLLLSPPSPEQAHSGPSDPAHPASIALQRRAHATIVKVSDDLKRRYTFNTAIAACMELTNLVSERLAQIELPSKAADLQIIRECTEILIHLLFPMIPHTTQTLWERLGHRELLDYYPWPLASAEYLVQDHYTMALQINGKTRGTLSVPAALQEAYHDGSATEKEALESFILSTELAQKYIGGSLIQKYIIVPKKIINIILSAPDRSS